MYFLNAEKDYGDRQLRMNIAFERAPCHPGKLPEKHKRNHVQILEDASWHEGPKCLAGHPSSNPNTTTTYLAVKNDTNI